MGTARTPGKGVGKSTFLRSASASQSVETRQDAKTVSPVAFLDLLVGILPVAVAAWFYARWLQLFPLIEFRSWLWFPTGWSPFLHSLVAVTAFLRSTGLFEAHLTETACALNIPCINSPGYGILLACGYMLYLFIFRLLHTRIIAATAASLWLFSLAVLDSVSWQATLLDKNVTFFCLFSLNIALFYLNRLKGPAQRHRVVCVVGANVAILVPVVLAYNSKETAWVLLPSLFLLPFVVSGSLEWRRWLHMSQIYVVSTVYAAYRMVGFFAIGQGSTSNSLDFAGSPLHNLTTYLDYFANRLTSTAAVITLLAALVLMIALVLAMYRRTDRRTRWLLLWAVTALLGTLILSIFTVYPGPYLMLLPQAFLCICISAAVKGFLDSLQLRHSARWLASAALLGVGAWLMLSGLVTSYPLYANELAQSQNFVRELGLVARYVPQHPRSRVYFVLDTVAYDAFRFVGTPGERDVTQFIFRTTRTNPGFEADSYNTESSDYSTVLRAHPDAYYIVFDSEMRLEDIRKGSTVLFGGPGRYRP